MNASPSPVYQTVSALMSLFVAILLHPEIQKKAQDELDSVVGRERLPTFEDRPRLPFINAMCKETLRWRPTTPLGVFPQYVSGFFLSIKYITSSLTAAPHAATRDDIHSGLFIPKGEPRILNESG